MAFEAEVVVPDAILTRPKFGTAWTSTFELAPPTRIRDHRLEESGSGDRGGFGLSAGSIALIGFGLDSAGGSLAASVDVWWRADSVAGLGIAALAVREGLEAWRGD